MATPTSTATTNPATQGTIVFVQGEAYLRDRQGKLIAIKPGDAVVEGQEIVTAAGAVVELQLPSGAKVSIGPDRQVLLNDELFATAPPESTENIVSSLGAEADKVIQALNSGRDPFADLEEPAAGLTAGANGDQTHDFVRLVRILEDVTPLAFSYTSSTDGIDFLPVSGLPASPTPPANQPPIAIDDPTFSTREDEPLTLTVLPNDSDPDQDPIGVIRATSGNGTVTINPDGSLRYVPNPDFNGTDTITYTISDGKGGTSTATATVNVTSVNDAPVARPDTATTDEDTPVTFPVLGNDSDADGDPLTVTTATVDPALGKVVVNPDGTLSFTPASNVSGPVQITYTITDGKGGTSTAIATVTVSGTNDVPVQVGSLPDRSGTDATPITIPTASGFADPDAGDTRVFSASGLPAGLRIDPATGEITGTLASNASVGGPYPITVTLTDGSGSQASQTFTLQVANPPPTAQSDALDVTENDTRGGNLITGRGLGGDRADSDPDGDTLTITTLRTGPEAGSGSPGAVGTPLTGTYGTLTLQADGSYTYTADRASALAKGDTATDTFTYTVSDGQGGTDTAQLVITVSGTNEAPVQVGSLPDRSGTDATPITIPTAGGFADPDAGDTRVFSASGLPAGLRIDPATGEITGTLARDASVGGPYPITVTLTDGSGSQASQTFTLQVANPPPTAQSDALDVTENDTRGGNLITGRGLGGDRADSDPDGDTLTITTLRTGPEAGSGSPGAVGTPLTGTYGTLTLQADGSYTYTADRASALAKGDTATDTFTYTVSDGQGGTDTAQLVITVTGTNAPPKAESDALAVTENDTRGGNLITGRGLGGDRADSDPDGDTLTITTLRTGPETGSGSLGTLGTPLAGAYGTLTLQADGSYTYTADRASALAKGDTATDTFTYTVSDGQGGTDTAQLVITVTGTNAPPKAESDALAVTENDTRGGNLITGRGLGGDRADSDPDGDTLTITTLRTGPEAGSGSPGAVGTPLTGTYGTLTLQADGSYTYTADRASALAKGDTATATDTFTYTVSDGQGGTDTAQLVITVTGTNAPPKAEPDALDVTENDTRGGNLITGRGLGGDRADSDPDGDALTITTLRTGPEAGSGTAGTLGTPLAGAYGTLTLQADGSYTYTADRASALAKGDTATDTFTYTVSDGQGGTSTTTLTVSVTGTNDAPTTTDTSASGLVNAPSIPITLTGKDVDGRVDSFTLVNLPANGTLYLDAAATRALPPGNTLPAAANGTLTLYFKPNPDWKGSTTFDFSATDDQDASSSTATASITVAQDNHDPVAADNRGLVIENETLSVTPSNGLIASALDPRGKDSDPDGDTLTITAIRTGPEAGSGTAGTLGTPLTGAHGKLTLQADGSYTYIATDDSLAAGQPVTDTFTYTVSDGQGGTDTAQLVITVTGTNDAPVVDATTVSVSEEGLPGNEADTTGNVDTTNLSTRSGTLSFSDVDNNTLTVTLSAPGGSFSSGGVPITWTGDGTQTLVGSAGGRKILSATIADDGDYTVTLSGPIDHPDTSGEDTLDLVLGVAVSDGTITTHSPFTIRVEDDAPQAAEIRQTINVTPVDTNLLLVLDTSGSMNTDDGVNGSTRLETAIRALNQLLDSYDNVGEVRVRLVNFNSRAYIMGSEWSTVAEAKDLLATLETGGATNYDKALDLAQTAFGTPGKLASGQNIAYFLSDGIPVTPELGVDAIEEASWKSFLGTNQITSFALGMGSSAEKGPLDPIAYDGVTQTDLDAQVITDLSKLAEALQTTIPPSASGEILYGGLYNTGFGADGGVVHSITVDGVTYTPDTNLGTVNVSGGTSRATYDVATHQIRVLTPTGGMLALDFDTGSYTYTAVSTIGKRTIDERFAYVLTDKDGDSAQGELRLTASRAPENVITLTSPQQVSGSDNNDGITGSSGNDTILAGAGNDIVGSGAGDDLIAGGAGKDTLTGGTGADTFQWSFGDAGTTAAPAVDVITDFDMAAPGAGGDVLDLRDLLQGEASDGSEPGNLGNYLHFEKLGTDTVVHLSTSGGFSSGNYGATDQKLILQAVDLTTLGDDSQIIKNLLNTAKLHTD